MRSEPLTLVSLRLLPSRPSPTRREGTAIGIPDDYTCLPAMISRAGRPHSESQRHLFPIILRVRPGPAALRVY